MSSLASTALAQPCGVASLFDLCQLAGRDLSKEQRQELVGSYPAGELSMLDIKQAAEKLELPLVGVAASFEELTSDVPGPKIVHLSDPAHFLVMARATREWVQLLDGGRVGVVRRETIQERYSGHALILDQSQFPPNGPRLELPEFHYTFGIAGVGQEVEHAFTIRNAGDEDLVVVPQQGTCCGAPKVTIPTDTLKPGAATQVTVSFTISYSGSVVKSAKLLTTNPTQPVVYLTVHGKVPHDLRVYPDRIYLASEKGAISIPLILSASDGGVVAQFTAADLPGPLPVIVQGLDEAWDAAIVDLQERRLLRHCAVWSLQGFLTLDVSRPRHVFIGHPVVADEAAGLIITVPRLSADGGEVIVHNPTDRRIETRLRTHPALSELLSWEEAIGLDPGETRTLTVTP